MKYDTNQDGVIYLQEVKQKLVENTDSTQNAEWMDSVRTAKQCARNQKEEMLNPAMMDEAFEDAFVLCETDNIMGISLDELTACILNLIPQDFMKYDTNQDGVIYLQEVKQKIVENADSTQYDSEERQE